MKPLKRKVSITLDEDVIECVKVIAEQDDRSFSQYINLVLKEHIERTHDEWHADSDTGTYRKQMQTV